ncbi:MAG: divergent polysaccharide deacetylase family protein [Methylocystis sp.]
MNDDELHRPLGQGGREQAGASNTGRPRPARTNFPWTWAVVGAGAAAVVASALVVAARDPLGWNLGGRPYSVARIEPYKAPPEPPPQLAQNVTAAPRQSPTEDAAPETGRDRVLSLNDLDRQSGVKVTRNGDGGPGPIIIRIEPSSGVRLPPAPDRRVAEKTRFGLLPRIGAAGERPMDVYSRPFVASASLKANAPKIALVIGGVGLNPQTTEAAIDELPEAVTLAFAPYGENVSAAAARARARGHETLLQAPMEPFDYPQNNPGPHTLRIDASDLDDLHWLLGRFTGYAGVMNFMGGRFTSDERALSPVLAELAQRGLFFLDDGAAPQSLVGSVAPRLALPTTRVDVILDAKGTQKSLDAALAQLEAQARQNGAAIGFANAQTLTIARLARFARDVERRGVAIAPLSATLAPGGAAAAAAGADK